VITSWQKRGFLVFSDDGRLVDVEASNKLLDARPAVHNGGVCSPPSGEAKKGAKTRKGTPAPVIAPPPVADAAPCSSTNWTTAEAIRRKESANALMRQLEYEQKAGRLLPADEVEALWRGHITDARKRLLTVPSRCASRLSRLSKAEVQAIDREIRDALQDLAGAA